MERRVPGRLDQPRTLEDVRLQPLMAMATAQRQDDLVDAMRAIGYEYDANSQFSWRELADALTVSK